MENKMMSLDTNITANPNKQLSAPKGFVSFPNDFLIKFSTLFSLLLLVFMAGAYSFPGKTYVSTEVGERQAEIFEETPGEVFGCDLANSCCEDFTVQNTPPVCEYLKAKLATETAFSAGPINVPSFPANVVFQLRGIDADSSVGTTTVPAYQDLKEYKINFGLDSTWVTVTINNPVSADKAVERTHGLSYATSGTYTATVKFYDKDNEPSTETCSIVIKPQDQAPTYSIGDFVWEDKNGDGIQNDTEIGTPGDVDNTKEIELFRGDRCGVGIATRVDTDENGAYRIDGLIPGTQYSIKTAIGGWLATTPNVGQDTKDSNGGPRGQINPCYTFVMGNSNDMTIDFGFYKEASFAIFKKGPGVDNFLPGAVFSVTGPNGFSQQNLVTSDAPVGYSRGRVDVLHLFPGEYTATEITPPQGYTLSVPASQTISVLSNDGISVKQLTFINTPDNTPPTVKSCETVTIAFENDASGNAYTTHYVGDKVYIKATGTSTHANGVTSFKFRFGPAGATTVTCGKTASTSPLCNGITKNGDTYQTTLTYTLQTIGAFNVYGAACDDGGADSCSEFSN